jgi:cytidylate kinase
MPVIAITREMGTLGKDVAVGLGAALGLPVVYHEVIDQLADRMRLRKSHVVRLLDGKAGLFERLTADKTSMAILSADEILGVALQGKGAIIRGWGATHLLREVPHALCVRVCAPFQLRKRRMMERLNTDDAGKVSDEIQCNDEAHSAIMRRHFDLQWTDPEHYDLVLNTQRVSIDKCIDEVMELVRSPAFAETEESRQRLEDLALSARVRAALRRAPETRDTKASVMSHAGRVTLSGDLGTDKLLAAVEVVASVPGVRDFDYRVHAPEEAPPPHVH